MFRSTPHSSVRTSMPAMAETVSRRKSAPTPRAIFPTASAGYVAPVDVSLCTRWIALGRTRSASAASRATSSGPPPSTVNSVTSAPARTRIPRMSAPNCPATTTMARSPGSITDVAPASRAVRPEPGRRKTSPRHWKTVRRASRVGSSTRSSKLASYCTVGGAFMAWMTENASSVGPGIISVGRVRPWAQLIVGGTGWLLSLSSWRRLILALVRSGGRGEPGLAVDEVQVAQVHEQARPLAEDEDGVAAVDGVEEEREAAAEREVPEEDGDHALLPALRRDPLHDEAGGEERLPEKADGQPDPLDAHHEASPRTSMPECLRSQSSRDALPVRPAGRG